MALSLWNTSKHFILYYQPYLDQLCMLQLSISQYLNDLYLSLLIVVLLLSATNSHSFTKSSMIFKFPYYEAYNKTDLSSISYYYGSEFAFLIHYFTISRSPEFSAAVSAVYLLRSAQLGFTLISVVKY